jgi:hypothetical protein
MADFVVRIELHNATREDYGTLHEAMSRAGFVDTLRDTSGSLVKMPPGEYFYSGSADAIRVRDTAYTIAASVRPHPGVLVTQSLGCWWQGLRPA